MDAARMAQALGRLGGLARNRCLSADARQRIAATGGRARRTSLLIAARIAVNFRYAAAAEALAGRRRPLARHRTARGPLPGPR